VLIFDCNGVLVDSEPIAAAVAADEFVRIGIPITPELVTRYFFGRRPADMFALVEAATHPQVACEFRHRCRGRDIETPSRGTARHSTREPCADLAARAEMRGVVLGS
jgi:beta-phosphoglucomutase-like phosphatase (HAD superfamily)